MKDFLKDNLGAIIVIAVFIIIAGMLFFVVDWNSESIRRFAEHKIRDINVIEAIIIIAAGTALGNMFTSK